MHPAAAAGIYTLSLHDALPILMGVYAPGLTETIASVLGMLGSKRAIVVRAEDGLDEISTASDTKMTHLRDGEVQTQMRSEEHTSELQSTSASRMPSSA